MSGKTSYFFTMAHLIANTLKNQVSTYTRPIYNGILNRFYALSILNTALDFTDCRSKQNT